MDKLDSKEFSANRRCAIYPKAVVCQQRSEGAISQRGLRVWIGEICVSVGEQLISPFAIVPVIEPERLLDFGYKLRRCRRSRFVILLLELITYIVRPSGANNAFA